MDISNKTLAMFLVAAIVVSIGGTVISLNKMSTVGSPTGFATNNLTGYVNLSIANTMSISIVGDTSIDFGSCTNPVTLTPFYSMDNGTETTFCTSFTAKDNITIQNDGNVHANVTVNVSNTGESTAFGTLDGSANNFLNSPSDSSYIAYMVRNKSGAQGCAGDLQDEFVYFTNSTIGANYTVCQWLSSGANNKVVLDVKLGVPPAVTSVGTFYMTFIAQNEVS